MARRSCCRCSSRSKIERGPANKSLDDLLEEGVVDATIGTSMPESIRTNPNIGRLFPDYRQNASRTTTSAPRSSRSCIWSRCKESVYEKYPFVATSLFNAFEQAKEIALEKHV